MPVSGPSLGPLAQTVAFHRDPLGVLRRARARHGDLFTLRLATVRPIFVVADLDDIEALLAADPRAARAGEARREMLPMASPRSIFGSDGARHAAARRRVAAVFEPDAVERRANAIAAIAARHVDSWPRTRPMRLLPRMRAVVDEVFVRILLGVADGARARAIAAAIRRMLWTPGNPPLTLPGEGDGLLGAAGARLFERRQAPLARLLVEEIDARRRTHVDGEPDDILERMLADEPSLPAEALVDELLALVMAAQEPAAAALTWVLERLARQPELAAPFAAPGTDPARRAIVLETLRLRPAAIAALRRLTTPRVVAGRRLPAGSLTMVPIPLVHRDPRVYPDPDDFRPERWRDAAPGAAYLPFGGGARRCLGEALAWTYFASIVPAVVRRVRLRPAWPRPERMVLRGTILVPHRSALVRAVDRPATP
ncbi:MAG: cytochrome family [Solirubrobacteraceae bacterium]|nr:cytochrome family [Solirubrobacteraceae bacterium]